MVPWIVMVSPAFRTKPSYKHPSETSKERFKFRRLIKADGSTDVVEIPSKLLLIFFMHFELSNTNLDHCCFFLFHSFRYKNAHEYVCQHDSIIIETENIIKGWLSKATYYQKFTIFSQGIDNLKFLTCQSKGNGTQVTVKTFGPLVLRNKGSVDLNILTIY